MDKNDFKFDFEKSYEEIQENSNKELLAIVNELDQKFQQQTKEDNSSVYIMKYITEIVIPLIVKYGMQINFNSIKILKRYHDELIIFLNSNNSEKLNE